MIGRMDLEARLRALRESKQVFAATSTLHSPVATASSISCPNVPCSSVKNKTCFRQHVRVAEGGEHPPVRRASTSVWTAPPVTIISSPLLTSCAPPTVCQGSIRPPKAAEIVSGQDDLLQLTAAEWLGPDYEEAVRVAQYAIDNERKQMPLTAIDAYIRAGQMFVDIGRRQAVLHLQDVVKAKAFALLQRAEGLSNWTNEVLTNDLSQDALAAAYEQAQVIRNQSLSKKQVLIAKMQQDNHKMKLKLNKLGILIKFRGRMMKIVKERRAKKAAQANETQAQRAMLDILSSRRGFNDVTGEVCSDGDKGDEEGGYEEQRVAAQISFKEPLYKPYQHKHAALTPAAAWSPRKSQRMGLINELHNRIGLPQIDHHHKYEPLTKDPTADNEQEILLAELEAAKAEAKKLRSAVQEMEQCLRQAAQHSRQRTMSCRLQKNKEFADVQSNLCRLRKELEVERLRSAFLQGGSPRSRSLVASDSSADEYEDSNVIERLRSSLYCRCDEELGGWNGDRSRRTVVHRNSSSHGSPRHTDQTSMAQSHDENAEDMKKDEDGGVWL